MRFKVKPEKCAQKKPQPLLQVLCQNRHVDRDFACVLKLRGDATERVASLVNPEPSFNVSTLTGFKPFQIVFLFSGCRVRSWFSKFWSVQMNVPFFAVPQVFSGAEYGIGQDAFRIMSIGFAVVFYGLLKGRTLVKGVPSQILYPEISVYIAHLYFGPEFHFRILLPANNGSYPGL